MSRPPNNEQADRLSRIANKSQEGISVIADMVCSQKLLVSTVHARSLKKGVFQKRLLFSLFNHLEEVVQDEDMFDYSAYLYLHRIQMTSSTLGKNEVASNLHSGHDLLLPCMLEEQPPIDWYCFVCPQKEIDS